MYLGVFIFMVYYGIGWTLNVIVRGRGGLWQGISWIWIEQ